MAPEAAGSRPRKLRYRLRYGPRAEALIDPRNTIMTLRIANLIPLLEVFDLPASVAFYRDILGFTLISGDDTWWAMLELDGVKVMLNTAYDDGERPAVPDAARVRGHRDTSLYFSADTDAVYAHLRGKGVAVAVPSITSYGMRQVSIVDPDGFQLIFIEPVKSAKHQAEEA